MSSLSQCGNGTRLKLRSCNMSFLAFHVLHFVSGPLNVHAPVTIIISSVYISISQYYYWISKWFISHAAKITILILSQCGNGTRF